MVQLVRPSRVVEEPGNRGRDIEVPGLFDGLTVVLGLGYCKLSGPLLHDPCDSKKVLTPLGSGEFAPGLLIGRSGRLYCQVNVLG